MPEHISPRRRQVRLSLLRDRARRELAGAGVPDPEVDLDWLIEHVTAIPRLEIPLHGDRLLDTDQLDRLHRLLERRRARVPLQHLIGWVPFLGARIEVGPSALIPRPETELLARAVIEGLRGAEEAPLVLDLGTGTGCLAIAIAIAVDSAVCHAADLSEAALDLARRNVERNGLHGRIHLHPSDWFSRLPPRLRVDRIVANPPYIPSGELDALEPEVRLHDPRLALDGGPDGLDPCRVLCREGRRHLRPGGELLVEVGQGQAPEVRTLFGNGDWEYCGTGRDLGGIERILRFRGKVRLSV